MMGFSSQHRLRGSWQELRGIWKVKHCRQSVHISTNMSTPKEIFWDNPWATLGWPMMMTEQHSQSKVKVLWALSGQPTVFPMGPNAHKSTHSTPLCSHASWNVHRPSTVPSEFPLRRLFTPLSSQPQSFPHVQMCMCHPQYSLSSLELSFLSEPY